MMKIEREGEEEEEGREKGDKLEEEKIKRRQR